MNFTQEVAFTVRIATDRHDWGFPPATFWTSNWRNAYIDQWLGPSPFVSGADYTAFNWVKPGTSNGLVVKFVNGYDDSFTFTFR